MLCWGFFFQAEDGIRDAQESRGLGDVYKRQACVRALALSGGEKPILSAGSLYLVGYIKDTFLEYLKPVSASAAQR